MNKNLNNISEDYFLFLLGANLHLNNNKIKYIESIMQQDSRSIIPKYISLAFNLKSIKNLEFN